MSPPTRREFVRGALALVLASCAASAALVVVAPSGGASTQSVDLDGTNNDQRIEIDITGGVSVNMADSDFTLEIWIRPTAANNNNQPDAFDGSIVVDGDNFSGDGGGFVLTVNGNVIDVGLNPESTSTGSPFGYETFSAATPVNDNAWHWIAFTWDVSASAVQLYVDGAREINATYGNAASVTGNIWWTSGGGAPDQLLVLGREKQEFNADGGFHGRISEMRISPSILYSGASITVPTAPLDGSGAGVAYYAVDEGSGSTVADSGGGTNSDGTLVNGVWNVDGPY